MDFLDEEIQLFTFIVFAPTHSFRWTKNRNRADISISKSAWSVSVLGRERLLRQSLKINKTCPIVLLLQVALFSWEHRHWRNWYRTGKYLWMWHSKEVWQISDQYHPLLRVKNPNTTFSLIVLLGSEKGLHVVFKFHLPVSPRKEVDADWGIRGYDLLMSHFEHRGCFHRMALWRPFQIQNIKVNNTI